MKKQFWYFIFLLFYIGTLPVQGKITLPAILSDNMVLQQKAQVRFWGKARPGEKVTVSTSWDKNIYTVQTPTDGHWEVKIKTPGVMDNQTLTVKGENTITIHNILIGEVWLCTGQSNMEFPVARDPNVKWKTGILNETEEMKMPIILPSGFSMWSINWLLREKKRIASADGWFVLRKM